MKRRRRFSRNFKVKVVKLVTERGVSISQAAQDRDIAETVIRRWVRSATRILGKGVMNPEQTEIYRLRRNSLWPVQTSLFVVERINNKC